MYSTDDTIVAIATPPGRGGIGVVRISGPAASGVGATLTRGSALEPRRATLSEITAPEGYPIDQAVATFFPTPHSYTGEDVVELSAHGSPVVLEAIVRAAVAAGARLAKPGEFTLRAYLHGRIDLVQAEAVADLIDAVTPLQARVALDQLDGTLTDRLRRLDGELLEIIAKLEASLDFPDEGYHFITPESTAAALQQILDALEVLLGDAGRGQIIREGLTVAIVGTPNSGKSSLFNRLVGTARAIVTEFPGTTRDVLTERVDVEGVPLTLIDTAGLREGTDDPVEQEGIARARTAGEGADLALVVLDRSRPLSGDDWSVLDSTARRLRVVVASKADLAPAWPEEDVHALAVSSLTDEGIDRLRAALLLAAGVEPTGDPVGIANIRHVALLERARTAVRRACAASRDGAPEEFVVADLHEARVSFDEVTGARSSDEVLRTIFDRFCIGK